MLACIDQPGFVFGDPPVDQVVGNQRGDGGSEPGVDASTPLRPPSDAGGGRDAAAVPPPTNACAEGATRPCGPETAHGICKLGVRTCRGGAWGECEGAIHPAPRDCTSELDNDCDGLPDDTLDEVCICRVDSAQPCDEHPGQDGVGRCVAGQQTCVVSEDRQSSDWGECVGAVGPAEADGCDVLGDDATCDGNPNVGCNCVEGVEQPCGPATDFGICVKGTSVCLNGEYTACEGAVLPEPRDCSSSLDNDCDGLPDNTVDAVCTCRIGTSEACGAHPGLDGNGPCKAGSRLCEGGANNATSTFGACIGSVGPGLRSCASNADNDCNGLPDDTIDTFCTCTLNTFRDCDTHPGQDNIGICRAGRQSCLFGPDGASTVFGACQGSIGPLPADSCIVAGDDSNCDGVQNGGCQCVPSLGNQACSGDPTNSRCDATGRCVPCAANADCSLVAGGRNRCNQGVCVACVANADCGGGGVCQGGACVECTANSQCQSPARSRCDQNTLTCGACALDSHCAHLSATPACNAGTCVQCTAGNDDACAPGQLCDPASSRCLTLSPVGVCGGCVASVQCGASAACVLEPASGNFTCLPRSVGGSCPTAPFSVAANLAEASGGGTALVCLPRLTSCQALTQIDGGACTSNAQCGGVASTFAQCALPPPPAAQTGTCTLPCIDASDCPAPRSCSGGLCSPR